MLYRYEKTRRVDCKIIRYAADHNFFGKRRGLVFCLNVSTSPANVGEGATNHFDI